MQTRQSLMSSPAMFGCGLLARRWTSFGRMWIARRESLDGSACVFGLGPLGHDLAAHDHDDGRGLRMRLSHLVAGHCPLSFDGLTSRMVG